MIKIDNPSTGGGSSVSGTGITKADSGVLSVISTGANGQVLQSAGGNTYAWADLGTASHNAVTIGTPANGLAVDANQVVSINTATLVLNGVFTSDNLTSLNGKWAVQTTGAISATTPISVTASRQALGGALAITINTANLVPYAGATSNLDLGAYGLTVNAAVVGTLAGVIKGVAGVLSGIGTGTATQYLQGDLTWDTAPGGSSITTANIIIGNPVLTVSGGTGAVNNANVTISITTTNVSSTSSDLAIANSGGVLNAIAISLTTGALTGTAPVTVGACRVLGSASVIALTTSNLASSSSDLVVSAGGTGCVVKAVSLSITTGVLSVVAPLTTDNGRRVLGGALQIGINTANIPVYVGATSALNLGSQQFISTGLVNLRSATVCVQTGTSVTLTSAGALCVDTHVTTGAMLGFYADAQYRLPAYQTKSFVIDTPDATADFILWKVPYAVTLKEVHVVVTAGVSTSVVGFLDESTDGHGAGATACSSDVTAYAGTNMLTAVFDNAGIAAGNYLKWHTTSGGTANSMCCSFTYTVDAV